MIAIRTPDQRLRIFVSAYLRQSDVFIGIYGQQYGWIAPDQKISGLEDEYLNAGGKPKLVYVQSLAPDRRLSAMLSRIQSDGLSYRGFGTNEELCGRSRC